MPVLEEFRFGRAVLRNGAPRGFVTGSPSQLSQSGDVLSVSGRYTPKTVGGVDPGGALGLAESDAFRQQWLGMAETPDRTIPIMAPARFHLDGFWFCEETSVTDVDVVTDSMGVFDYSGTFRRLAPSYAQAGEGFVGTLANRDTSIHGVTPEGYLWWPFPVVWDEPNIYGVNDIVKVDPPPGASDNRLQAARFTSGVTGTNILQLLGYGVEPGDVYLGACTIERQGDNVGDWFPVQGRQLTNVDDPVKIRLSNGLVRAVYDTSGIVYVSVYSQDNERWDPVGEWDLFANVPTATPAVVIESPETCTLRFPIRTTADERGFLEMSIRRGDQFVTCDIEATLVPAFYQITQVGTFGGAGILTAGGIYQDTASSAGHRWIMLSPYMDNAQSNPSPPIMAVPGANASFALGGLIDDTSGYFSLDGVRSQYWKIIAAHTYPVSL